MNKHKRKYKEEMETATKKLDYSEGGGQKKTEKSDDGSQEKWLLDTTGGDFNSDRFEDPMQYMFTNMR